MYPGSRLVPEPTRAMLAQDDESYWQDCAAQAGGTCFDLADAMATILDRHAHEWSADDLRLLRCIERRLNQAMALVGKLAGPNATRRTET
jgi:hypothetical protein